MNFMEDDDADDLRQQQQTNLFDSSDDEEEEEEEEEEKSNNYSPDQRMQRQAKDHTFFCLLATKKSASCAMYSRDTHTIYFSKTKARYDERAFVRDMREMKRRFLPNFYVSNCIDAVEKIVSPFDPEDLDDAVPTETDETKKNMKQKKRERGNVLILSGEKHFQSREENVEQTPALNECDDENAVRVMGCLARLLREKTIGGADPSIAYAFKTQEVEFIEVHIGGTLDIDEITIYSLDVFANDNPFEDFVKEEEKEGKDKEEEKTEDKRKAHKAEKMKLKKKRDDECLFGLFGSRCVTKTGKKMLQQWFWQPSNDLKIINDRFDQTEHFIERPRLAEALRQKLKKCSGIDIAITKIAKNVESAIRTRSDWKRIKSILEGVAEIGQIIREAYDHSGYYRENAINMPNCIRSFVKSSMSNDTSAAEISLLIERSVDTTSSNFRGTRKQSRKAKDAQTEAFGNYFDDDHVQPELDIVLPGVSSDLDELRRTYIGLPDLLARIANNELSRVDNFIRRSDTIFQSLTVEYIADRGFFCRVKNGFISDATMEELPDYEFIYEKFDSIEARESIEQIDFNEQDDKKEPANILRYYYYTSDSTRALENEIGDIASKAQSLHDAILRELRKRVLQKSVSLRNIGKALTFIDVFLTLALASKELDLCRPTVLDDFDGLVISKGRHLAHEQMLLRDGTERHIPIDTSIEDSRVNTNSKRICILSGPNMSGKTLYMKSITICCLLAHIGIFVPAKKAKIGIVDAIFTRLNSPSKLLNKIGQSVFLYDVNQISRMLKRATRKSLIVVDEFGHGMEIENAIGILGSTILSFDEMKHPPKAFFSTHYAAELADEEIISFPKETRTQFLRMRTIVHVNKKNGHEVPTFLYQIEQGVCEYSFAIEVARTIGFDEDILKRAKEILLDPSKRYIPVKIPWLEQRLRTNDIICEKLLALDLSTCSDFDLINFRKECIGLDQEDNALQYKDQGDEPFVFGRVDEDLEFPEPGTW